MYSRYGNAFWRQGGIQSSQAKGLVRQGIIRRQRQQREESEKK